MTERSIKIYEDKGEGLGALTYSCVEAEFVECIPDPTRRWLFDCCGRDQGMEIVLNFTKNGYLCNVEGDSDLLRKLVLGSDLHGGNPGHPASAWVNCDSGSLEGFFREVTVKYSRSKTAGLVGMDVHAVFCIESVSLKGSSQADAQGAAGLICCNEEMSHLQSGVFGCQKCSRVVRCAVEELEPGEPGTPEENKEDAGKEA